MHDDDATAAPFRGVAGDSCAPWQVGPPRCPTRVHKRGVPLGTRYDRKPCAVCGVEVAHNRNGRPNAHHLQGREHRFAAERSPNPEPWPAPLPRPTKRRPHRKPRSIEGRVRARLVELGKASTQDLARELGLRVSQVALALRRVERQRHAHKVGAPAGHSTIWEPGPGEEPQAGEGRRVAA